MGFNGKSRHGKLEQMVPIGRPGLYHRGIGHGAGHGSGPRLPVLRTGTTQVGLEHDLGLYGFPLRRHLPMVFLGLFAGILADRDERIHWKLAQLWIDEHVGRAQSGLSISSRITLCLLPGMCGRGHAMLVVVLPSHAS